MANPSQSKHGAAATGAALVDTVAEAQQRGTAISMRASEIMANGLKAIWQSQADLLRVGAERSSKGLAPISLSEGPGAAMAALYDQWHDNTENLVAHMRSASDIARDCGWQMMKLYADSMKPIHIPA